MGTQKHVTVSDVEVVVKPIKKRDWKKTVLITFIGLLILCSLCGWGTFAAYLQIEKNNPEILYWLKIKERPSDIQNSENSDKQKEEENNVGDEDKEIVVVDKDNNIKEYGFEGGSNLFNLRFTYLDKPELITDIKIIKSCTENACETYKNEDFDYYKVGLITSGYLKGKDIKGFEQIIVVNRKLAEKGYIPFIQIYIKSDKSSAFLVNTNIPFQIIGIEWESFMVDATDSYFMNPSEFGFMNFIKPESKPAPDYAGSFDINNFFFKGEKSLYRGVNFEPILPEELAYADLNGKPVDKIAGYDIYQSDQGFHYIKSVEGFLYKFNVYPAILTQKDIEDYEVIPEISWINKIKINSVYEFQVKDKCGVIGSERVDVVDIKQSDLVEIGKGLNNIPVYGYKDKNHSDLKKIYNEDYVLAGLNRYNDISEDDFKVLTYDQFLARYPVFFYFDVFGRAIRFVSRDFVVGGC